MKKYGLIALLAIVAIPVLLFGGIVFMDGIDDTQFPKYEPVQYTLEYEDEGVPITKTIKVGDKNLSNEEKGILLTESVVVNLKEEMNTFWGWSLNDLIIMPSAWMDNRASRQKGVLYATKKLSEFHITNFTRLNGDDDLNIYLNDTFGKWFLSEGVWGMVIYYDEGYYENGFDNMNKYYVNLANNNTINGKKIKKLDERSTFNPQTSDQYNALRFLTSDVMLGVVKSKLQGEDISFTDQDNRIYEAQGIAKVVRSYLHTLVKEYPEIIKGEADKNLQVAYDGLDKICNYNPLIVWDAFNQRAFLHNIAVKVETAINNVAQEHRT